MKTLPYRLVATAILWMAITNVLLAQIPDWYSTHKTPRYPAEMYLIGVGAGSGDKAEDAAKKAAQVDLVSQIRVQVQAQIKSVSESFQFNKDEQMFSDFRSSIRTAVSDEIAGMEVAETLTDKATGTSYALVVLDREKYCENLKNEMDAGWKQAEESRTSSANFARQGKLDDALQSIAEARTTIKPLLTKQALYNVVASTPYQPEVSFSPTTLTTDMRGILTNVRLSRKSGDKQWGKVGERFGEPFVVQATISQDGNSVPIVGSTIVFETSDKTKVGEATTDDEGIASLSTTVRAMTGNGIRARLAFKKIDREFEQNLQSSAVWFAWKAEASNIVFALKISSESPKVASTLKSAFTSAITQIGYKVLNSSTYVLQLAVETGESNKIEGMAGTMYSVSANVIATLVDKGTGNTLGSATFPGKGLARSESEAIEKAVANVKVGQKEMAELLQKAGQN